MEYSLQHAFLLSWLVLFPCLKQERRLHNLIFLLESYALGHSRELGPAGFNDFHRAAGGVASGRLQTVLAQLRNEGMVGDFDLTDRGRETFRALSSVLLYDPLYSACIPLAERYRQDLSLIDRDIAAHLLVKKAEPGKRIQLGQGR